MTSYTYDAAGNVKTMQDARGQSATYAYDALDRLRSLVYADESLSFPGLSGGDDGMHAVRDLLKRLEHAQARLAESRR